MATSYEACYLRPCTDNIRSPFLIQVKSRRKLYTETDKGEIKDVNKTLMLRRVSISGYKIPPGPPLQRGGSSEAALF